MVFQFQKARREKRKLRLAMFGPSGAGKTYSALRLATGLANGGRIAVIDTEAGASTLYADKFDFDILVLDKAGVDVMVQAIQAAARAGYDVLIVDSLSHAWAELLEEVDRLARAKYGGNTWSAWSEGTPKQKRLIRAILSYPGHFIATMRAKTEWTVSTDDRGKVRPVRVGLAPEQGKGIEYEFDMLMMVADSHEATIIKDRTGKFQDKVLIVDEDFGRELRAWLEQGEEPSIRPQFPPQPSQVEPGGWPSEQPSANVSDAGKNIVQEYWKVIHARIDDRKKATAFGRWLLAQNGGDFPAALKALQESFEDALKAWESQ